MTTLDHSRATAADWAGRCSIFESWNKERRLMTFALRATMLAIIGFMVCGAAAAAQTWTRPDIRSPPSMTVATKTSPAISPESAGVATKPVQAACPFGAKPLAATIGGDDGCAEAPTGAPLHPSLLKKYGSNRPPWNVAGVEYAVGMPTGKALADWQSISTPGVDLVGNVLRCDGTYAAQPYAGPMVLDGIDFTTHGGLQAIYVPAGGCPALLIANSRFGSAGGSPGCTGWSYYQVQNQNVGAPLTLTNNTFDMADCGYGQASVVNAAGPVIMKYNYFGHFQGQILQAPSGAFPIDYRYNLIEDGCYFKGNHMNFQEFGGSVSAVKDVVAFNTTYLYQVTPCGGEEFQFYGNSGGEQTAAVFAYNTIITMDTGNCRSRSIDCLASYAVHGTGAYSPATKAVAPALNVNNYFDRSGMFGSYYPRSMLGWTSSGNIDLNTGATIVPP